MNSHEPLERFASKEEACRCAQKLSKANGDVRYVIESPPASDEPGAHPGLRFVVDTDGFTRSWERTIAVYENGIKDKP